MSKHKWKIVYVLVFGVALFALQNGFSFQTGGTSGLDCKKSSFNCNNLGAGCMNARGVPVCDDEWDWSIEPDDPGNSGRP